MDGKTIFWLGAAAAVAACATPPLPEDGAGRCRMVLAAIAEAVAESATGDAAAAPVPGFPYLRGDRFTASFAAETGDLVARARAKLDAKHLDLIVANDVSQPDAGFEVDTNRATLLDSTGSVEELPLQTKLELADVILDRISALRGTNLRKDS